MISLLICILVGHIMLVWLHAKRIALRDVRIAELECQREADIEEAEATYATMRAEIEVLRCGDLVQFIDGELDPARAAAYRLHLGVCTTCPGDLKGHMQLDAKLAALARPR